VTQKNLQTDSNFNKYDIDGDGIVTDEELAHAKEIGKTEADLRKQKAQRRMATATLIGMGAFTAAMFLVDIDKIKALSDISNLFYISGAGIVGAYMGTSAWMSNRDK
jgi:NADPH-dependent curcumin reductase CurA|tara:strand:- start:147 stop:467 length:321 start_codon:yes stop_codon:yes gene_type:complete